MIDNILHIIGICPDNSGHIDLVDLFAVYGFLFSNVFYIIKMNLVYIKNKICSKDDK